MRWQGRRESSNVEDRRGSPAPKMAVGGGIGTIVVVLIALFFGVDPRMALNLVGGGPGAAPRQQGRPVPGPDDQQSRFAKVVFADTEDVWNALFAARGRRYDEPTLVLFRDGVDAEGCGLASSAVGPFYCPANGQVYIDLDFFDELDRQFGAPGEFARAYVLAHEVGHHVQNLEGTSEQVQRLRGKVSQAEYNQMSVRLELQADYYAGVWAHHAQRMKSILEPGDVEDALRAAAAIGDDTLQRRSGGRSSPESFTHGTSEQRVRWFRQGLQSGDWERGRELFELRYADL